MLARDRLVALHLAVLAELQWRQPGPVGDAVDQFASGALLDSDDAGMVSGRGASTAARWAQAAEEEGAPIAVKAGSWLFVTSRLLDYIERKSGLHARREAETRHRKLIEMRARPQPSSPNASRRAAPATEACDNEK